MKSKFAFLILCLICGLGAGTAAARPLQRADVGANPVWVVHLDCDLLRSTAIGQFIQTEMDKPEAQAKLAAFQALFSFDLRTQLHGLTLYGTGPAPEDGVLLVYADIDEARLVTLAKAAKDAQQTQYKQTVIYSWVDAHKKARNGVKPRTYAAVAGSRVVFGQREERVGQALDVLSGAAPNLASGQTFPELSATASTSFLQAAARKLDFMPSDPNAAVLRLAKLAVFQLGETRGQLAATLTLQANDEEVAANMASIAQGLIALMKLQKEKPESVKFAEALTLKQEGPAIVVKLNFPAADAIDLIKADAARKAQKKAAREHQQ